MSVPVERLNKLTFFDGLSQTILQSLAEHMRERTLHPNEILLHTGEESRTLYLVARGVVRKRRISLEGREYILAYVGPGSPINLVSALDGEPLRSEIEAVTTTQLYAIPSMEFRHLMRVYPPLSDVVIAWLNKEIRYLYDTVEELALHTVRTRLARFLLDLVQEPDGHHRWTQEEIAARIGTVREMVSRTLRAFAQEGLIRREQGRIVILDPERLALEAQR